MTRKDKIKYIKSFDEPPYVENYAYCHRHPWQKFGGVSSGICMRWCWYRDDVIEENATDEDVNAAYEETLNSHG